MDVKSAKAILTEPPYGFVRALTGQPGVSDIKAGGKRVARQTVDILRELTPSRADIRYQL